MRPRRFPEADIVYRLPGGNEDNDLWCARIDTGCIYSEWQLTDTERAAVAAGARVGLVIYDEPIPPVSVGVVAERGENGDLFFVGG